MANPIQTPRFHHYLLSDSENSLSDSEDESLEQKIETLKNIVFPASKPKSIKSLPQSRLIPANSPSKPQINK